MAPRGRILGHVTMELQWPLARLGESGFHPLEPPPHCQLPKLGSGCSRVLAFCDLVVGTTKESCEAPMTMSSERAHPEFLGETQRTAVVRFGLGEPTVLYSHFAEQAKSVRLVATLLVLAGEFNTMSCSRGGVVDAACEHIGLA